MDIEQLVNRYVEVWNEADPVVRRRTITELWEPDGVQTTENARYEGHDALEVRITGAHDELVRDGGFVFRSADDVASHHGVVTFSVHMVPAAGGDIAWTGRMFVTLGEGMLIQQDYQFAVAASQKASTRAITEEFLRLLGEGEMEGIAELFAERVEWLLDWPEDGHPAVPWIRPRATRDDVADHFRELAAFHIPEKSAGGVARVLIDDQDAVVLGDIQQTVRATGKQYTALFALHLTVENGLITRYAVYEDSLTVAEALESATG
jgi:ketosteroid isomerase-like protein